VRAGSRALPARPGSWHPGNRCPADDNPNLLPIELQLSLLALHGNVHSVARPLADSGQGVEEGDLAIVRITRQGNGQTLALVVRAHSRRWCKTATSLPTQAQT